MSYDPFQPLGIQMTKDTAITSQLIDTFLAAKSLPQASRPTASAAKPETQKQTPATGNVAQTEATPQTATTLMFGIGALLLCGIALLLVNNDSSE